MDYDVCIIGAGVAGALAAYKIAQSGKTVVMLDAGPRFDFLSEGRYGRVKRGEDPWEWEVPERDLYEESASPGIRLNDNRVKGVGGTTLKWNASSIRLQPNDFKMQSLFGVGADWPIGYSDLQPWYLEAEQELGVAGKVSPNAPPREYDYPLSNHPLSYADKNYFEPAFNKLGLSLGSNPLAINSREYDDRPQCALHSTCIPMCPIHAKYTAMVHIHKAEETGNVKVKPNCQVTRIQTGSKRKIRAVSFRNRNGLVKEQKAKVFILASGGVEIPRLLLLSSNSNYYQNGLANSSGQVGKNYMTHPSIRISGRLPEKVGSYQAYFDSGCSWDLYKHKKLPEIGNVLLYPNTEISPTPADIASGSKIFGKDLKKRVQQEFGHRLGIFVEGEMLPKEGNSLQLSKFLTDSYGDPAPYIEMQLSDFEKQSVMKGSEIAQEILREMGATSIKESNLHTIGNHIIGTTRLGEDPGKSVCDKWGRCHDLDNLYITSSSLFPTAGAAAPTLTIAALALRTADYISKNILGLSNRNHKQYSAAH